MMPRVLNYRPTEEFLRVHPHLEKPIRRFQALIDGMNSGLRTLADRSRRPLVSAEDRDACRDLIDNLKSSLATMREIAAAHPMIRLTEDAKFDQQIRTFEFRLRNRRAGGRS